MTWRRLTEPGPDGAPRPVCDADGTPVWTCEHGVDRLIGRRIAAGAKCRCPAAAPAAADPAASLAAWPCAHRGVVGTIEVSLCGTCSRTLEIAPCELHGECTVAGHLVGSHRAGDRRRTAACLGCRDRIVPKGSS